MGRWEITNEPTQDNFNKTLINELERMTNIDEKLKAYFDESKIKEEIQRSRNLNSPMGKSNSKVKVLATINSSKDSRNNLLGNSNLFLSDEKLRMSGMSDNVVPKIKGLLELNNMYKNHTTFDVTRNLFPENRTPLNR